ncbi:hypothetical protein GW17_00003232 [Ensete ventricosum]|nr:hypothetical protein GW17_00003232 [Ensete ventricosum]
MFGSGRFSISDVYPSGLLLCASIRSVSAEENLHKGLVGMGVSDRGARSVPPRMPTWLWHWREPSSDSDADVAVELAWVLLGWVAH